MLKLWGRKTSINVQKVMWLCAEMGLEIERIDAGGEFGGLDSQEFSAMNPNKRVPVLQDGDLTLWESNAIARYIASNYNAGALWSDDPQTRALADQWMDWQAATLWQAMRIVFLGQIRTPPEERDNDAIAAQAAASCQMFQIVDKQLEGRDFLLGDQLTLADIPVGATCYRYMSLDIDRPETPNVARWYDRLQAREVYRTHVMIPMK